MNTDLSTFRNLHSGSRCFIVGAGPSLAFQNVDCLADELVICVNSSILLMSWDDKLKERQRYWISNDSMCLKWDYFRKKVLTSKCTRLYRDTWSRYRHEFNQQSYHYFRARKDESGSQLLSSTDGGLCSVSSIPTAIDLALLMGCKSIYLLGVDQQFAGEKTHFWHHWPQSKWPKMCGRIFDHDRSEQKSVFVKNENTFRKLHHYAQSLDAAIYNCSPTSELAEFEKRSLHELFPTKS